MWMVVVVDCSCWKQHVERAKVSRDFQACRRRLHGRTVDFASTPSVAVKQARVGLYREDGVPFSGDNLG